MKHTLTSKAAELMRKNGRHRRWRRAFSGMAAVVVFITTYMLILPAITMENQAICGMAEHTHTDACYEMQLVCTQEETPEGADVHVHGPECYEQQQVLTCTKQEGEGHTHTDACYGYVCGQEESAGHTHTDACYTEVTHRELTCTEPESAGHTHGDGCYDADGNLVCTEAESTGHTHGDSCYTETVTRELTCGQEESSGHTHTDACIGLICGQEEYEGHTHTDACYTTEDVLVCTQPTGHTHGDGCYEKVLVCDVPEHTHTEECYPAAEPEEPQEPEFICTLPEHSHEDACYDADGNLICGMEEHTHTEECYAPVEIPEEETPTTAFPEEIPEGYVEYTFDNEAGLTVTAYAPEGAFGQDVQLFAEVLPEDSEEYAQAKENLDKAENAPEYTGMTAMDIRFVDAAAEDPAQAEEIEPDAEMGQVFVKIDAQALIPEDVDESTLAVQHHAKVSDGGIFGTGIFEHTDVVVETVADNTEETGDITAVPDETALPETLPALADEPEMAEAATLEEPAAETEETQPVALNVEAEFAVDSFSTFTITWTQQGKEYNRPVSVYLDGEEVSLEELHDAGCPISDVTLNNLGNWQKVDGLLIGDDSITQLPNQITYKGTQYRYDHATNEGGTYITHVRQYKDGAWLRVDSTRQKNYNNYNSPDPVNYIFSFPKGETLRLYYYSGFAEPITTADTSGDVAISIFDYTVGGSNQVEDVNGKSRHGYSKDLLFSGSSFDSNGNYSGQTINSSTTNVPTDAWNHWTDKDGGVVQGAVQATLDESGYPVTSREGQSLDYLFSSSDYNEAHTGLNYLFTYDSDTGYYSYDSALNFATLVQDDGGIGKNFTVYNRPNSGTSEGSSGHPYFIPLNAYGTSQSNQGSYTTNYHFGMQIDIASFLMPKDGLVNGEDMTFKFAGDDDVWVYIDGVLILDMGGIHDSNSGSINFADGTATVDKVYGTYSDGRFSRNSPVNGSKTVYIGDLLYEAKGDEYAADYLEQREVNGETHWYLKDYTFHSLSFFYLERGSVDSNCAISFNLPVIPKNSLLVGKELVDGTTTGGNAEITSYLKSTLEYTFKVLKVEDGQVTDESFLPVCTTYSIQKNGHDTGRTGTISEDGTFTLKADEIAVFGEAFNANSGAYVVREIMKSDYTGQYDGVGFTVTGAGGTTEEQNAQESQGTTSEFTNYQTETISSENTSTTVIFKNKVKYSELSLLKVTKVIAPGADIEADTQFPIIIKLDGESIAGVHYTITDAQGNTGETKTVGADGIISIKGGETINITEGILVGTQYEVLERNDDGYYVSYEGMVTWTEDGKTENDWPDFDGAETASGTFEHTNSVVYIAVQNADYEFAGWTTLNKYLDGAEENDQYTFTFEAVEGTFDEKTYTFTQGAAEPWTFTVDTQGNFGRTDFVVGYKTSDFQDEDFDQAGNAFRYYKVQEIAGEDGIRYDTGYYIVRVEISKNVATDPGMGVTGVLAYRFNADGTYAPNEYPTRGVLQPISFTNSKIGELSIAKVVERTDGQAASGRDFQFGIVLKEGGKPLSGGPYNYTVYQKSGDDWTAVQDGTGTLTFNTDGISQVNETSQNYISLDHNQKIVIEGLPAAAQATITETTTAGYSTKWSGNTGTDNEVSGATVTTKPISEDPAVTCTNTTGAVLPSTGGMGTTPFLALGTLLTLGAGMLLVQRRRKEGSDAV